MNRKVGINIDCINRNGVKAIDTLVKAHELGFEAFFTPLYSLAETLEIKGKADELGMNYEFIHAPFTHVNCMWANDDSYKEPYENYIKSIDVAASAGVKTIIMHVSSGWKPPQINDLGLTRFDSLIDYAEKKGVIVAIENLRRVGNFAYMMQRYEDRQNVVFCYDVGHEHCYTATVDMMSICGDKILCTHVHDNVGRDKNDWYANHDSHHLPFDGTIDYEKVVRNLDKYGYNGSIMLEVFVSVYPELSADEFLKTAYERAVKIACL